MVEIQATIATHRPAGWPWAGPCPFVPSWLPGLSGGDITSQGPRQHGHEASLGGQSAGWGQRPAVRTRLSTKRFKEVRLRYSQEHTGPHTGGHSEASQARLPRSSEQAGGGGGALWATSEPLANHARAG